MRHEKGGGHNSGLQLRECLCGAYAEPTRNPAEILKRLSKNALLIPMSAGRQMRGFIRQQLSTGQGTKQVLEKNQVDVSLNGQSAELSLRLPQKLPSLAGLSY